MPRPQKFRFIAGQPRVSIFKPAGVPTRELERIVVSLDGFEAIRLVDYEGLDQDAAAERLGVSRPTVTRILQRARRAVAAALVNGTALVIEGGNVVERPPTVPGFNQRWRGGRGGGRGFRGGRGGRGGQRR